MDAEERPSRLVAALLTIIAVWAILIGTGMAFARWQPHLLAALLSFAVCVALLFAWARWTAPGRRTPVPVFMLSGLLYLILIGVIALAVPPELATGPLNWLAAGLTIGFHPDFAIHPTVQNFIAPLLLNLFGPIVVMGLLRGIVRGDWRR